MMAHLAKLRALGLRQEAGPRIPPGPTVCDPLLPPRPPLVGQEKPKAAADVRGRPRFSKRASATASSRPARQQRTHLPLVLSLARVIDAGLKSGAVVTVAGLRSPAGPAPGRPRSLLAFAPLSLLS